MKKALLVAGITTFSLALMGIASHISQKKYSTNASAGQGDDIGDYYNWQIKRLADPATGKIPDNIRSIELAYAATLPSDAEGHSTSANWQERGPWNVGGRTRSFAADVKDESILLAGSCSGGM